MFFLHTILLIFFSRTISVESKKEGFRFGYILETKFLNINSGRVFRMYQNARGKKKKLII